MSRLALVALAGCGRIGFATQGDGGAISVRAVPGPVTLLPFAAMRLAVIVDGTPDQAVTWSIDEPALGKIDGEGVVTAIAGTGTVHVRATSVADPTASARIALAITAALAPVALVAGGAVTNATGMAHQTHLLYAPELGSWWLFHEATTRPTKLLVRSSSDFATWTDVGALELGHTHGDDGRNLTVADRVIGGVHVVHVSAGYIDAARGRVHAKATLSPGAIAFGAPVATNAGGVIDPDGPAVAITGAGFVVDGSGWDQTPATPPLSPCGDGDAEVYTSSVPDAGATSFDAVTFAKQVIWCVPARVDARYLYADGETLYMLYEDGIAEPDPGSLIYNIRRADGTWLPDETVKTMPPPVFAAASTYSIDDWTARPIARTLHAIRRLADGATFEHRELALGSEGPWSDGAPIVAAAAKRGSGVYVAAYGTGMVLVQLDPGGALEYAFWDGVQWSPWTPLDAPAGPARDALAGSTPVAGERPAIMWMEGATIVGAPLP